MSPRARSTEPPSKLAKYSGYAWCKHEVLETRDAVVELWHWARAHDWRRTGRILAQRRWWGWYALIAAVIILSAVLSSYHEQIARALRKGDHAAKIANAKWTWIIPFVLLIIVSFPPLFGHELILLVCGLIWGIGPGFVIACAGTFFGELATYLAFKYLFREKARQFERESILYACIAKLMREGGLYMLCLVRFSAMPGHITTAIQSCIGISIWLYGVACFLTLPKQFSLVYIGKIFGDITLLPDGTIPSNANRGDLTPAQLAELDAYHARNKRISLIVFFATIAATVIAAYMVYMRARAIRPQVIAEMEARKLAESGLASTDSAAELGEISRDPSKLSEFSLDAAGSARLSMIKRGRGSSFYTLDTPSLPHIPYQDAPPDGTDDRPDDDYFNSKYAADLGRRKSLPASQFSDSPKRNSSGGGK